MLNKDLHYTVVGLGLTGLSCVEFLVNNDCLKISVIDTRSNPPKLAEFSKNFPDIPVILNAVSIPDHTDLLLLSPGVALDHSLVVQAKQQNIQIIGDVELFAQLVNAPVVAITGANGKSTVVTLIYEMAKAAGVNVGLGANIGTPVLSLLANNYALYVLELSSFQLESIYSLKPKVAAILNITSDHMDRYANFAEYKQAKLRIYYHAENMVINREDSHTWLDNKNTRNNIVSFGLDVPANNQYGIIQDKQGKRYLAKGQTILLPISKVKLFGEQNLANALAALAVVDFLHLSIAPCLSVLETFAGLPDRCEIVGDFANILWINDSKGTNVGATIASIAGVAAQVKGKLVIILGGDHKKADLSPLVEPVLAKCRAVIILGHTSRAILVKLFADKIPYYLAETMDDCILFAKQCAIVGDGVLLSPACTSLDMFENFHARGLAFKQAVAKYAKTSN